MDDEKSSVNVITVMNRFFRNRDCLFIVAPFIQPTLDFSLDILIRFTQYLVYGNDSAFGEQVEREW